MSKIADLFNIQGRFWRSAQLERDFYDPSALKGYVVTPTIRDSIDRLAQGLEPQSGQRAWRITGDYGSGKSSFALLLAQLFSGRAEELPTSVKQRLNIERVSADNRLLPVLITGSREPMTIALLRGLKEAMTSLPANEDRKKLIKKLDSSLRLGLGDIDKSALGLIQRTATQLVRTELATGLLILLDELGKFLEFAALHPERQDILILQQLAELSTRSRENRIFTVGILHQGFNAYAEQLSEASQREWEKVAGRFEELLFDQPLEQITQLIASALNVRRSATPSGWKFRAAKLMSRALSLGWFGPGAPESSLTEIGQGIYPLHPSIIPVLVRLFRRFGQNERSLFSFLLSSEPFGLQAFCQQPAHLASLYRIHDLYDFAAANFAHRLGLQSYRNHWNHIDSLVRSFSGKDELQIRVLKTIGLLNLINAPELQPTDGAVTTALGDGIRAKEEAIRSAIKDLHQEKQLLYFRGAKAGYWLWGHTSINLEIAYEEAGKLVGAHRSVTETIKRYLDTRPIVARRHYIRTGNLRHFEIRYCSASDLERNVSDELHGSDGRLVIPLSETKEEMLSAESIATKSLVHPAVLVGITEPLASLRGLIYEVERWAHIEKSTPELKDDKYAYEEVMRRLAVATLTLERRVQHYVGLREASQTGELMPIRWYREGKRQLVTTSSSFLSLLSDICDEVYDQSPTVHNELLNRRVLSSAAAAARMRLLERILESSSKPYLDMDPSRKPPEMSMYLSVLQETRLHRSVEEGRSILATPEEGDDPCHLRPALLWTHRFLAERPEERVSVKTIFSNLRQPPFGIRDGLLPLLLVAIVLEYQHEIAVYEDGTFKSRIIGPDVLRLTKDPKCFELQWVKIEGVKLEVFERLTNLFELPCGPSIKPEILDIVRPLCQFVAKLPLYTRQTFRLTERTRRVREAILDAREPAGLLFRDLPIACGMRPVRQLGSRNTNNKEIELFIDELRHSLEELKVAMGELRIRISQLIQKSFGRLNLSEFQNVRDELAQRSERLLVNVTDIELKAFCLRLFDNNMPQSDWIESIGSLVANVPPSRWKDQDEDVFQEKLGAIVQRFLRVESVNFASGTDRLPVDATRIAITQQDGSEQHEVIYLSKDEQLDAKKIAENLRRVLGSGDRITLAALSKITWEMLERKNERG
jgi:hypothetical protein